MMGVFAGLVYLGLPQMLVRLMMMPLGAISQMPAPAQQVVKAVAFRRKTLTTIYREFQGLARSAERVRQCSSLGDLPLVVLRHGKPGPTAPGVSAELAQRIEQITFDVQTELAQLSSCGIVVTAK